MKFGLPDASVDRLQGVLARQPQVEKAILYGSRAKGNFRNGSDIDLTLYGGSDLDMPVLYRILEEIDDLLLPYQVDLSLFHDIDDPELIAHIQRVGLPFYEKVIHP
ncbi:MAG: nucleotidyltransferase domain-containing protein [Pseudomonadota bacterium]|nr:nucleotidyltransferase domain-containing protein [Pseudomonadota bacterium]